MLQSIGTVAMGFFLAITALYKLTEAELIVRHSSLYFRMLNQGFKLKIADQLIDI